MKRYECNEVPSYKEIYEELYEEEIKSIKYSFLVDESLHKRLSEIKIALRYVRHSDIPSVYHRNTALAYGGNVYSLVQVNKGGEIEQYHTLEFNTGLGTEDQVR